MKTARFAIRHLLVGSALLAAGCSRVVETGYNWLEHPNPLVAYPTTAGFIGGSVPAMFVYPAAYLTTFDSRKAEEAAFFVAGSTGIVAGAPFWAAFGWWGPLRDKPVYRPAPMAEAAYAQPASAPRPAAAPQAANPIPAAAPAPATTPVPQMNLPPSVPGKNP